MKTTILVSLLCLSSLCGSAQFQYTTKDHPILRQGERIPVTPAFDGAFTVVTDTPCYMYISKHGLYVVDCPGVWFPPEKRTADEGVAVYQPATGDITVQGEKSYSGYYPGKTALRRDPEMPANAVPAYPTSPYIPLYDPPCYRYIDKKGVSVMECHGLQFLPDKK